MPKNVLKQFIPDRFQKLKRSASNHNCDEEIFPRRRVVVKRETKSLILDRISDEEDESDLVVVKEMPSICEESEDDERIMEYGSDSSRKSNALRNFFRDHFIKTNKISSSSIDDFNNQKNLRRTLRYKLNKDRPFFSYSLIIKHD